MTQRSLGAFWGLLGLSLLASYAPALFWVPSLPGSGDTGWVLLVSPVVLLLMLDWTTSVAGALGILGAFLMVQVVLAWCLRRSRLALLIVPVLLFAWSLMQGLYVAELLRGIDAIGRS